MTKVRNDVTYSMDGSVAVITINRPESANALSRSVREGLFAAWERFESSDEARVAILTGAGQRAFCAGADLHEMAEESAGEPPEDFVPVLGENVLVSKPTIAAVNGAAYAGGFLQVQMCDLAIASRTARFGISEAKWGRGSPWVLPLFKMIPTRTIMELLLTAQPIDAQRAREVGFVNHVVEPSELMNSALAMARTIAENAPLSLSAAKEMAKVARMEPDVEHARRRTKIIYESVYRSEDAQIGPRAFREGTKPMWTAASKSLFTET